MLDSSGWLVAVFPYFKWHGAVKTGRSACRRLRGERYDGAAAEILMPPVCKRADVNIAIESGRCC